MALRSPLITVMIAAAQKASKRLIRDFGEVEQLQVSRKGPADFVSAADKRTEDILFNELRKARPEFGFLMEESGEVAGKDTSNRWIIDPLDGTTNFLHGIPHFAISIALERDREPYAGVIYNPITDELYWAEKGKGAHLKDRRLRVSGRDKMEDAIFATGIPFLGAKNHALVLKQIESVMGQCAGIRRFGAAALDLAYTAAGRFDGFWESGIQAWDMAAGIVIAREAGALVTEIDGGKNMLSNGNVLAVNPTLQGPLQRLLRGS
jgi:myo-inositol-1(or 4)-monophosphatase